MLAHAGLASSLAFSLHLTSRIFSAGTRARSCYACFFSYITLFTSLRLSTQQGHALDPAGLASSLTLLSSPHLAYPLGSRACSLTLSSLPFSHYSLHLPSLSSRQVHMLALAELASSLTLLSSPPLATLLGRCTCWRVLRSLPLLHYSLHFPSLIFLAGTRARTC